MRMYVSVPNRLRVLLPASSSAVKHFLRNWPIRSQHFLSVQIFVFAGDKAGEGKAYGNIGICYENLGDFQKAIEYSKKDLEIAQLTGGNRPMRSQHFLSVENQFLQATKRARAGRTATLETRLMRWASSRRLLSTTRKIWRSRTRQASVAQSERSISYPLKIIFRRRQSGRGIRIPEYRCLLPPNGQGARST